MHGTQRYARKQLQELVVEAGKGRVRAGTLGDLLEQWFEAASPSWAATTVSHTRSIIDCHLKPDLGHLYVAKLTRTSTTSMATSSAAADGRAVLSRLGR